MSRQLCVERGIPADLLDKAAAINIDWSAILQLIEIHGLAIAVSVLQILLGQLTPPATRTTLPARTGTLLLACVIGLWSGPVYAGENLWFDTSATVVAVARPASGQTCDCATTGICTCPADTCQCETCYVWQRFADKDKTQVALMHRGKQIGRLPVQGQMLSTDQEWCVG